MRAAVGGMAAGMSANAAAASQLMIAAAAAGQNYQYTALGSSQLLTQDSTGLGFPVSSQSVYYLNSVSHSHEKLFHAFDARLSAKTVVRPFFRPDRSRCHDVS